MEFFLRYHLSETGIAYDYTTANANTFEGYQRITFETAEEHDFAEPLVVGMPRTTDAASLYSELLTHHRHIV